MKPIHPAAELFPLMEGEDFDNLCADIETNGLRESIWLDKAGRIVDGRNRARACEKLGIFPTYRTWDGDGSPVDFVLSLNLNRRHMSQSQRAVLALGVEKAKAEEARKRMARGGRTRPSEQGVATLPHLPSEPPADENGEPTGPGRSRELAGAAVGVSPRYVQDAKFVEDNAPDLLPLVRSGEMSIPEAKKTIARREEAAAAANRPQLSAEQQREQDIRDSYKRSARFIADMTDDWPYFWSFVNGKNRSEIEAEMVPPTLAAIATIEEQMRDYH